MSYDELCKNVLELDPRIRFTGVLNNNGKLLCDRYKEGIEKLLSSEEIAMSFHYTLQSRKNVSNLAYKIGKEKSSVSEYEKATLIYIPLNEKELFLLSTEPNTDYLEIISKTNSLAKNYFGVNSHKTLK
jgi:Family of unknown function (DUF6659)